MAAEIAQHLRTVDAERQRRAAEPALLARVTALKAFLAKLEPNTRALLVTHGVVINALTGISPATGEMIVVSLDARVLGRVRID